jgi:hypothetical protein
VNTKSFFKRLLKRTLQMTIVSALFGVADIQAQSLSYTVLTPTPGVSRVVYVSSSTGSASNSGLDASHPVQTLAQGYALLRDGQPDYLLLKRGDVWNGEYFSNWNKWGPAGSATPMVVSSYGSGPRPIIQNNMSQIAGNSDAPFHLENNAALVNGAPVKGNLAITDLHLIGDRGTASFNSVGIEIRGNLHDILIENNEIERFRVNIGIDIFPGQVQTGIKLRLNLIHHATHSGRNYSGMSCGFEGMPFR